MLLQILHYFSDWIVIIPLVGFFLGLACWLLWEQRRRRQLMAQADVLLSRDPGAWVRSLAVTPFPIKASGTPVVISSNPRPFATALTSARPTREQRAALRRAGNPVAVEVIENDSKQIKAWVCNRSTSGLCLASAEPLTVGATISIRSTQYGDSANWVPAQVRRCTPTENGWLVGCRFAEALPWNVLLHFG
jgi:hypothetical protein